MDNNIDEVFSEERKIKIVTNELKKIKGIKKEWFKIEETTSLDYTYSSIKLTDNNENYIYENGYICLLIGINPRGNGDYKQEIEEFKEEKKKNPNLRHRKSCKDSIERTRLKAITNALQNSDKGIKELVTIDLFSQRTNTLHELMSYIKDNPDKINEIIGNKNKAILEEYIEKAGIIIIAWGKVDNLWDSKELSDYKDKIYEWLNKDSSKVWWFGKNKDGSPKHASDTRANNICKITDDELKRVFKKSND